MPIVKICSCIARFVLSWINKARKIIKHLDSNVHAACVGKKTRIENETFIQAGVARMQKQAVILHVIIKLLRIVYFLVVRSRPLSDFQDQRELQVVNGQADIVVTEGEGGTFCHPGCNYNSDPTVREFLDCLADESRVMISERWTQSPFYGFMANEPTDADGMVVMLMYMRSLDIKTGLQEESLLGLVYLTLPDPSVLDTFLQNINSDDEIVGMSTDSASSHMSGRVELAKMLKEVWQSKTDRDISNVSVNHCAPHCIQLACNKVFKSVAYLDQHFDPTCLDCVLWYENSSVKANSLKWSCKLFGIGGTVKKSATTRWLARDTNVSSLREALPAIRKDLGKYVASSQATESQARAAGLQKKLGTFEFQATVWFLSDVLPI
eukprot:g52008.t1